MGDYMEDVDKLEEEINKEIESLKNFQELADSINKALAEKEKSKKTSDTGIDSDSKDLKNTEDTF